MKRLLLVASLAVAFAATSATAAAPPTPGTPGGYCDGDVDVVCRPSRCDGGGSDAPCVIEICGVWMNGACRD